MTAFSESIWNASANSEIPIRARKLRERPSNSDLPCNLDAITVVISLQLPSRARIHLQILAESCNEGENGLNSQGQSVEF